MIRAWKIVSFSLLLAVFAALLTWLVPAQTATAANPTTMSFQGKVVNANGTNVTDGSYGFTFKLYTASSGGSPVWTESDTLTVTAGVFQVNLGANCPFFTANACNGSTPIDFTTSNSLYLGITFNSDPAGEMTPRVQLQSVPYAFYADSAGKLGGLTASQFVQLSPGVQQSGFINVSGNSTIGGTLTVSSTINNATISGGTLSGSTLSASGLTFSAAGTATIQPAASQALTITAHATSTWSTDSGNLTIQAGSGTVSLGSSTIFTNSTGGLAISAGGTAQNLTLDAATTGVVKIAGTSTGGVEIGGSGTGDILLGGGVASSGCTITNSSGAIACTSNINSTTGGINTGAAGGTTRITNGGNLTNIGTITAASGAYNVDANGNQTGVATAVGGVTSTTNGTSGFGTSTSLVLTSAASFTVGDYVQVNDTNCGGTGINPCYAKITAKATNTLTITPALTWTSGKTVNEYLFPEIGGNEVVTPTLLDRYGRAWFISGVATGNGTTYYNEDGISSSLTTYNILADSTSAATTINIGNTNTTSIVLGTSGTTTSVAGSLATSNNGNISAGSGQLQGGSLSINSGAFAVNSSGAITASTGIATSGGYVQSGTTANTLTGATTFSATGTALTVTNTASIGTASVGAGGLNVTGSSGLATTTITGTASINTSGTAATTIGNTSAATAVNIKAGSTGAINLTGPIVVTETSGQAITLNDGGRTTVVQSAAGQGLFGNNTIYNGTNNVYQVTGASSLIDLASGNIFLTVAPSGTAGATETFTAGLTVLNNGNVGVATATPSGLFSVGASSQFQVNASGAITALTGIATSGGYVQSGSTANTLTGATTFSASGTALSVTNTASIGTLSVTSAGTFGTGLTVTTGGLTVSAGGAAITGNSTVTGNLTGTGRVILPMTSGTTGQGYFVVNGSSTPVTSFQGLDTGTNSFGFFAVNKYFNGSTWVDDGQGRVGSSFQIQDDNFNFYSFDTAANFTSRFVVASGGNVGVGSNVTPAYLLDVEGGDVNTSANVRTGGTIRLDNAGNLSNIVTMTSTAGLSVTAGTTLSLQSTTSSAVSLDSGTTGAVNIGTNANAKTITLGNVTGATGLVFNSGTAGAKFNLVASGQLLVQSASAPTVDNLHIATSGVTTAGVNSLSVTYAGGAAAVEGAAERIDLQPGTTSGGTWSAVRLVPNATGAVSGVTENGLKVDNLTTPGAGTENALFVGTGWDNVLKATNSSITQAGVITGVTVNATTGYQANGTAGITVAACSAGQYIGNGVAVNEGLITAGSCRNDATGLSDIRVKTNIVSLDSNVLDTIKQVNTVNFDFDCSNPYFTESGTDCDTRLQTGVIAQQLQQIFPQLVYTDDWGYFHVDYQGLSVETLKAVTQLAQFVNSTGDANFNSVVSPSLTSSGALSIMSGSSGDVSIDSQAGDVTIGANTTGNVNISQVGATTDVKGALQTDGDASFNGSVSMHFSEPSASFTVDNTGNTQPLAAAIQVKDTSGAGFTSVISTPHFSVSGDGSVVTDGSVISKGGSFQLLDASGNSLVSFDQSGSANFAGGLNFASATASGGLTIGGDLNVAGLSNFQKLATFFAKTVFRQDVEFDGHITVNKDTAGYAELKAGESTVHVTFTTPYADPPIANANFTDGQFGLVTVNNITDQGFDISLQLPAIQDTKLSWTAVGVIDPQTASNPPPNQP